jgi:hypothetical protein
MKTTNQNTAIVTAAPAALTAASVVIRPIETVLRDFFVENGERLEVKKGTDVKPEEIAQVILSREVASAKLRTQARWAYYSAGQLPDGAKVQEQIASVLLKSMSKSAFYQLKSEATRNIPVLLANGFQAPLSILKDAIADIKVDKDGKALPLKDQSKAGKKLLPLLKAGTVKQKEVRDIREAAKAPSANTGNSGKGQTGGSSAESEEAKAFGSFLASMNLANGYLEKTKLQGDDRMKAVTLVTNAARLLGLVIASK